MRTHTDLVSNCLGTESHRASHGFSSSLFWTEPFLLLSEEIKVKTILSKRRQLRGVGSACPWQPRGRPHPVTARPPPPAHGTPEAVGTGSRFHSQRARDRGCRVGVELPVLENVKRERGETASQAGGHSRSAGTGHLAAHPRQPRPDPSARPRAVGRTAPEGQARPQPRRAARRGPPRLAAPSLAAARNPALSPRSARRCWTPRTGWASERRPLPRLDRKPRGTREGLVTQRKKL